MADEFDRDAAYRRNLEVIDKVRDLRDMLNRDIIDYYKDLRPGTADQEEEYRQGIRKYLRFAVRDIDVLLDNQLRD